MKILENFFTDFMSDNFGQDYEITPQKWSNVALKFNLMITALTIAFWIIVLFVPIAISSIFIGIIAAGILYVITLVVISAIVIYRFIRHMNDAWYHHIPVGHRGVVQLLGIKHGSLEQPYLCTEGDFRDFMSIPLYGSILEIRETPTIVDDLEYFYEENKSADGIDFKGKHFVLPIGVYNPWMWLDMMDTIGLSGLRSRLEKISHEALNTTFDEFTSMDIMASKDNTKKIKENYYVALSESGFCNTPLQGVLDELPSQRSSSGNNSFIDTFSIKNTGLNVIFRIVTTVAPTSLKEKYIDKANASLDKDITVIKSQGEALALLNTERARVNIKSFDIKKTADAEAYGKNVDLEVIQKNFQEALKNNLEKMGNDSAMAAQYAALTANLYSHEELFTLAGPDGKPLEGALERLLSQAQKLLDKKKTA